MTNEIIERKYVKRLQKLLQENINDPEAMHILADRAIIAALDELGMEDLAKEFLLITENSYYA